MKLRFLNICGRLYVGKEGGTEMKKALISAVMLILSAMPLQAGKIEVEGSWYSFEEIVGVGNLVEKRERPSGLTGYTGQPTDFTDKPARIIALLGKRWVGAHPYINERFWPLVDPSITIKDRDAMRFPVLFEYLLPISVKTVNGSYELELVANLMNTEEVVRLFQKLVFAAEMADNKVLRQRCIEFRGRLTWWGLYNKIDQSKSRYTYRFLIESIQISNGWIPTAYGESGIPLEEATKICSDKD
jgi:hypothetical protein